MTNFEVLRAGTDEQLARWLARIFYLNCNHAGVCFSCPAGICQCRTTLRSSIAYKEYHRRRKEFFADPEKKKRLHREVCCPKKSYAGTVEKEFRDTIPAELWQAMTITMGECTKELLAWLRKESSE